MIPVHVKRVFLLVIALLASLCLSAQEQTEVQRRCTYATMKFGGVQREFYVYQPAGLQYGAPLVICLHGYGGSAAHGKAGLMNVADRHGFAVCYPQALKDTTGHTGWNVGYPFQKGMKVNDVDFIVKLSRHLCKEYGFSREDIFLTGMSNGGEMCYLTAQKKPGAFKAIASIAGLTLTDMLPLHYRKPVPFMEVHGTEDRISEWTGDPENKGGWGAYLAVPVSISHIVVANGCISETITELPQRQNRNLVVLHHFQGGKPAWKGGPAADVLL
ncbi:MAG: prolyl oligopeptidase family serine peptidase [Bacteroidales bacterium]|nr:prolyl oligopeptidase family serine peptidase [Bacteroidales bacterium]